MFTFLMVLHIFVSIVLILVILMQAGRGGGVNEIFGASSTQTIFGTSTAQFLTKATAACAILFIITSLSLAVLSSKRSRSLIRPGDILPAGVKKPEDKGQAPDTPSENENIPAEPQTE